MIIKSIKINKKIIFIATIIFLIIILISSYFLISKSIERINITTETTDNMRINKEKAIMKYFIDLEDGFLSKVLLFLNILAPINSFCLVYHIIIL